jgi:predicted RNA binding protein YcfA (HicA-like mRNA interferase family)
MPKKLKVMLKKAGFRWRPGKGSHTVWDHPSHPEVSVTVSGNDGDDAHKYQEKEVKEGIGKTQE